MANHKNKKTFIQSKISQKLKELNHLNKLKLSQEIMDEVKKHLEVKRKALNTQMKYRVTFLGKWSFISHLILSS